MQRPLLCQVQAEDWGCASEDGAMGLHPGDGKDVRVHYGAPHLPTHRRAVMVPLCLRVPDSAALQPGLQPGAADLKDPGRAERERHKARLIAPQSDPFRWLCGISPLLSVTSCA